MANNDRELPITRNIPVMRELPIQHQRLLQILPALQAAATTTTTTRPPTTTTQAPSAHKNAGFFSPSALLSLFSPSKGAKTNAKAKSPAVSPQDQGLSLLAGLGIQGDDATSLLSQINRASQIAKLPPEFQTPVQEYFAAQEAKKQQQPFVDPVLMQMFFASTIAPYIQKFAANTQQQIGQGYDSLMNNLPHDRFTSGLLRQLIPQEKAAALGEASAQTNAIGPAAQLDAIMQQLASSQQTQLQYAADLRNQASLGMLGASGVGGAAFTAPIPKTTK